MHCVLGLTDFTFPEDLVELSYAVLLVRIADWPAVLKPSVLLLSSFLAGVAHLGFVTL